MDNIQFKLKIFLDAVIGRCLKVRWVQGVLRRYYSCAVQGLVLLLKAGRFSEVQRVYLRHSDWILGVSDIDLVFVSKAGEAREDVRFLTRLAKAYRRLRMVFPMLCDFEEIRFLDPQNIERHPLSAKEEARLLLAPHKWRSLYEAPGASVLDFQIRDQKIASPPHTRFLYFNLYSYLQWALLSGSHISELRFLRIRKCIVKILQHIYYLELRKCLGTEDLIGSVARMKNSDPTAAEADGILSALEIPSCDELSRRTSIRRSFYRLLLLLDRSHGRRYELDQGRTGVLHSEGGHWIGDRLARCLADGHRLFGADFRFVVMRPAFETGQTLYILPDRHASIERFEGLLDFASRYYQPLREQNIHMRISTAGLLTSQFYSLWTPYALEAHIFSAREVYDPSGALMIKLPPDDWSIWKMRNSLSIAREYYLPLLISSHLSDRGREGCKMYERIDVQMLFHYFYFLRDRSAYLGALREAAGDSGEILSRTASRYGTEIGIQNWLVRSHMDAYPHIQAMIDQIDRMALDQMNM